MPETDLTTTIPFGPSTIIVGEGADALSFDGKTLLQAAAGEVQITPQFTDINTIDFGSTAIDSLVSGYQGHVQLTAAQQTIDTLKLALAATEDITDTESGNTVGLMDAKIGTSLRSKAKKVTVHPRQLPADDHSMDIVMYKVASNGAFTKALGNAQASFQITLNMMPRDGMNADAPGNFFFIGPIDPNAVPVTGVTLSQTTLSLVVGNNNTLTATVAPDTADQSVTWSSSDPSIATVDSTGKITAVATGSATITATSVSDGTKTATCTVTVTAS